MGACLGKRQFHLNLASPSRQQREGATSHRSGDSQRVKLAQRSSGQEIEGSTHYMPGNRKTRRHLNPLTCQVLKRKSWTLRGIGVLRGEGQPSCRTPSWSVSAPAEAEALSHGCQRRAEVGQAGGVEAALVCSLGWSGDRYVSVSRMRSSSER